MRHLSAGLTLLLLLSLIGCGPSLYQKGRSLVEQEQYQRAIDLYYQQIKDNPNSSRAWRELGYAYYKQGELQKAEDALEQATLMEPDPVTAVYRGMVFESARRYDDAINAYASALALNPSREMREMVNERLVLLTRERAKLRAKTIVEQEEQIDPTEIPENAVAVVDFDATSLPENMTPMARGLAELISNDLASIESLRVLERMQIDAILAELKLSESGAVNETAAPRTGKLLGSRRIITGNLIAIDEEQVRVDGAIIEVMVDSTTLTDATEGQLRQFFEIEKRLVQAIVDSLGVELTEEERARIDDVPTESLPAFLAWSRGLQLEGRGLYADAHNQYEQAIELDPSFGLAAQHMQATSGLGNNQALAPVGSFDQAVLATTGNTAGGAGGSSRMLQQMSASDGFIPSGGPTQPPAVPPQGQPDGTAVVNVKGDLDG